LGKGMRSEGHTGFQMRGTKYHEKRSRGTLSRLKECETADMRYGEALHKNGSTVFRGGAKDVEMKGGLPRVASKAESERQKKSTQMVLVKLG